MPGVHLPGIPAPYDRYLFGIRAVDGYLAPPETRGMGIGVLGPLTVEGSAASINRRDRVVLEALAAYRGHVLSPAELADAVWGERLPASWNKNLQSCVVRLRRLIGRNAIETRPEGYRLALGNEQVDAGRFERMVHRARELVSLARPTAPATFSTRRSTCGAATRSPTSSTGTGGGSRPNG